MSWMYRCNGPQTLSNLDKLLFLLGSASSSAMASCCRSCPTCMKGWRCNTRSSHGVPPTSSQLVRHGPAWGWSGPLHWWERQRWCHTAQDLQQLDRWSRWAAGPYTWCAPRPPRSAPHTTKSCTSETQSSANCGGSSRCSASGNRWTC